VAYDVVSRARDDDAERLDLVDAGVRGIERPRHAIESHFAVDLILKIEPETLGRPARELSHADGSLLLVVHLDVVDLGAGAVVPVLATVMVFPSADTTRV